MFSFFMRNKVPSVDLLASKLCNEKTFYRHFIRDLRRANHEVFIESPYLTMRRVKILAPELVILTKHGVRITVVTRDPREHDQYLRIQARSSIAFMCLLGVQIKLSSGYYHRKIAIIDSIILWEGSLNILSQNESREIMRRTESSQITSQVLRFIGHKMAAIR
jgi:phosphatidylserine/phosphatidylglycerophosphate/cardiolipin synthase-like enzyme